MVNQRWFKGVLMITIMITKDDDKGDDKKIKDQSKKNSSESRTIQEFKIESRRIQDSRGRLRVKNQRFKVQDLKNQDQDSRFKILESREGLMKISMKSFSQKLSSRWFFSKHVYQRVLLSSNRLPDCCNRLLVAKWIWKSFQMNLQRFNWFQKVVIEYNVLVIDYQCLWKLKFKFKCEESHPFT